MKKRTIVWFSCGAASAIAAWLVRQADVIAYCETGSEDSDNRRFLHDCERWWGKKVTILKSPRFADTWDVWKTKRYIAGVQGAPCTREMKIKPREHFQRPGDIHIFGFTADPADIRRAKRIEKNSPEIAFRFPLIERGLTKADCLALLERHGIRPPRVYALGMPNANCIPCPKASSPAYWTLIRKHFPAQFARMAALSRQLGARLARLNGERVFIDEIPDDYPTRQPEAPSCSLFCHLVDSTS